MSIVLGAWDTRDVVTLLLALASLGLSVYTLWATQLRRGRLKMTQPTLLCLKREMPAGRPKICERFFTRQGREVARFKASS